MKQATEPEPSPLSIQRHDEEVVPNDQSVRFHHRSSMLPGHHVGDQVLAKLAIELTEQRRSDEKTAHGWGETVEHLERQILLRTPVQEAGSPDSAPGWRHPRLDRQRALPASLPWIRGANSPPQPSEVDRALVG